MGRVNKPYVEILIRSASGGDNIYAPMLGVPIKHLRQKKECNTIK